MDNLVTSSLLSNIVETMLNNITGPILLLTHDNNVVQATLNPVTTCEIFKRITLPCSFPSQGFHFRNAVDDSWKNWKTLVRSESWVEEWPQGTRGLGSSASWAKATTASCTARVASLIPTGSSRPPIASSSANTNSPPPIGNTSLEITFWTSSTRTSKSWKRGGCFSTRSISVRIITLPGITTSPSCSWGGRRTWRDRCDLFACRTTRPRTSSTWTRTSSPAGATCTTPHVTTGPACWRNCAWTLFHARFATATRRMAATWRGASCAPVTNLEDRMRVLGIAGDLCNIRIRTARGQLKVWWVGDGVVHEITYMESTLTLQRYWPLSRRPCKVNWRHSVMSLFWYSWLAYWSFS